jgi:hypothetical protein
MKVAELACTGNLEVSSMRVFQGLSGGNIAHPLAVGAPAGEEPLLLLLALPPDDPVLPLPPPADDPVLLLPPLPPDDPVLVLPPLSPPEDPLPPALASPAVPAAPGAPPHAVATNAPPTDKTNTVTARIERLPEISTTLQRSRRRALIVLTTLRRTRDMPSRRA